jgi:DNA (cytosine-5)-methyltransferase 1
MGEAIMNYIDLFSGIGGFALGAYWAGMKFENHYFSEVEPFAAELYQERFPDVIPLGDITKIKTEDLPNGEYIITGGFPCQDISIAGKGAGITGERSGLWFEYWRLIRDLRPRFAIMENVGMLVHRGLREVLGSLAEIGYNAEWQDIRAEDMGAPHKRERIWIVAYPGRSAEGPKVNGFSGELQHSTPAELWAKKRNRPTNESENVPNANSTRPPGNGRTNATVKDSDRQKNGISQQDCESNGEISDANDNMLQRGKEAGNTESKRTERKQQHKRQGQCLRRQNWTVEPSVGRLVNGLPNKLDGD